MEGTDISLPTVSCYWFDSRFLRETVHAHVYPRGARMFVSTTYGSAPTSGGKNESCVCACACACADIGCTRNVTSIVRRWPVKGCRIFHSIIDFLFKKFTIGQMDYSGAYTNYIPIFQIFTYARFEISFEIFMNLGLIARTERLLILGNSTVLLFL